MIQVKSYEQDIKKFGRGGRECTGTDRGRRGKNI